MTNTRKRLMAVVCIAMLAVIAVFGTVAYLTDTESAVNVMTVGKVDIELIEQQRNADGSDLEAFEDGKTLLPIVGSAQGTKDKWGMPIAENYVDKIVTVENTGKTDAYLRVWVAVPAALENDDASKNALHWNLGNRVDLTGKSSYESAYAPDWAGYPTNSNISFGDADLVTIDGIEYNVYCFNFRDVLAAKDTTDAVIAGFYLDKNIDYNDETGKYTLNDVPLDYDLSEGVKIPVFAQAIQASGFDSAADAFDASEMGCPWGANTDLGTIVENPADLAAAIEEGGTVYVTDGEYTLPANLENVELIAAGDNVKVAVPAPGTANTSAITLGDGVVMKGLSIADDGNGIGVGDAGLVVVDGENVVIEDCSFDISGTNATAIALGGGSENVTIKDCDFVGGYKHIGPAPGTTQGIVIDNCSFTGANSTYGIHLNATQNDVIIKNSTIALFNTLFGHGNDAGALVFENCDFVVETGKINVVKLYRDAEFINCDFAEGFLFSDANKDIAVTFTGGSWGTGTIKDHFLADSFGYNMNATFDGDEWYWNTTTDEWEDK